MIRVRTYHKHLNGIKITKTNQYHYEMSMTENSITNTDEEMRILPTVRQV